MIIGESLNPDMGNLYGDVINTSTTADS